MKRFQWRLQRVLDIKQKEERAKRVQLVNITEQLSQARGELFMQKRILEDLIGGLSEGNPHEQLNRQRFFMMCSAANDKKISDLENEIKSLDACQKEKIREIVQIKQFNEGLEKLRQGARDRFFEEQEKREQRDLDETVTARFTRKIMTQSKEAVL